MRYFFVGIGGIGMSALAQFLVDRGEEVFGSDRSPSPTTDLLEKKGIRVTFGHKPLTEAIDVLVYSDSVPYDNPERHSAREREVTAYSYFELLGTVSAGYRTVAVAGTHGKTTTTGMLTKILVDCGKKPTAIIGSIVRDFGSNFVAGAKEGARDSLFVVEACEYKNHLLNLSPEILVITNLELDHTDFFPDLAALQETFKKAIERVPKEGYIVTDTHSETIKPLLAFANATVVDYNERAPLHIDLRVPGEFNQANARAALAAARIILQEHTQDGVLGDEGIYESLRTFQGSWRRFEYKGELSNGTLVYDDYAHHPTAVRKTIAALREKYPDKKICIVFHPHLYSRTKQFLEEFAQALATADEVVLAPIYAAREAHDSSVSSDILAEKISALGTPAHAYGSLEEVRSSLLILLSTYPESSLVLMTMGAGDIYKVAEQLVHE